MSYVDEGYGSDTKLRHWLEASQQAFVLVVACEQRLWRTCGNSEFDRQRVNRNAQQLPPGTWERFYGYSRNWIDPFPPTPQPPRPSKLRVRAGKRPKGYDFT